MRESELINFSINSEDKEFIGITSYGAIWTDNQPKYRFNFNKTYLKFVMNYLTDNCCFTLGSMCFPQLIGILMGPGPSFFMTNLLLRKEMSSSNIKMRPVKD